MHPTAEVEIISYSKLLESEAEQSKLFRICRNDGIFYMDLSGALASINTVVQDIYHLQRDLFSLEVEEKLKYDVDLLSSRKLNGYKPIGRNRGELNGKDGFEAYSLPKDGIMAISNEPFQRPPVVDKYMPSLQLFCGAVSAGIRLLLATLSSQMQIQGGKQLQEMHRSERSTPDLIRLLKYCRLSASETGASHVPHTDLGSLTFLFSEQPGLQIRRSSFTPWEAIEPLPGYCIVNLGDTLSKLSGGMLKSCLHRVAPKIPNVPREERYSFAYFSRAEDSTLMQPVISPLIKLPFRSSEEQEVLTSLQWIQTKYKALRNDTWERQNDWLLAATT